MAVWILTRHDPGQFRVVCDHINQQIRSHVKNNNFEFEKESMNDREWPANIYKLRKRALFSKMSAAAQAHPLC